MIRAIETINWKITRIFRKDIFPVLGISDLFNTAILCEKVKKAGNRADNIPIKMVNKRNPAMRSVFPLMENERLLLKIWPRCGNVIDTIARATISEMKQKKTDSLINSAEILIRVAPAIFLI